MGATKYSRKLIFILTHLSGFCFFFYIIVCNSVYNINCPRPQTNIKKRRERERQRKRYISVFKYSENLCRGKDSSNFEPGLSCSFFLLSQGSCALLTHFHFPLLAFSPDKASISLSGVCNLRNNSFFFIINLKHNF